MSAATEENDSDTFDVIVIGAGSTGTNVAGYARDNDLTVAVVEAELVGGECSYWACMPSKALLGPSHAIAAARRLPGAEEAVSGTIDVDAVLGRRDEFVSDFDDSSQADWVDSVGATLVRGQGRLVGDRTVDVEAPDGGSRRLTARRAVVVATGSRATIPPIDGLDSAQPWDNRDVTSASEIPRRLAIIGGGVVGCEMAQAYRRLGADEVTIIERADRPLSNYDSWVGELLQESFEDEGITVHTGTEASKVTRSQDGSVTISTKDGGDAGVDIVADEVLVAVGRTANSDDIGLESVGVTPDGFLDVDDRLRVEGVDGEWLYAAGDVNGRALLTHQGKYQARCIGDIVAGRDVEAWADHSAVPQVVFTDPEVAAVGKSELDAADDSDLDVVTVEMGSVAGVALTGQTIGKASIVIDRSRGVIVGATFVGANVGEILHSAPIANVGQVPIATLWHAVPAFPTVSEVWLRLLEADRGI
ncbi:MAG: NAD(P)/FAD-dependent oxidoreductase [Ilumatobacter sp.]|uniref:dihydrolipoyl dehydrogenase family protein n=1 Tax=Ilumatobacter sp. TaxID=1967498 RepID=UPI003C73975D